MKFSNRVIRPIFLSLVLMLTLIASISMAQTTGAKKNVDDLTDDEIALFLERVESSGMTEAQIEKAAKAQGYSAADIAKMRERISAVEDNDPYSKNNQNDENVQAKVVLKYRHTVVLYMYMETHMFQSKAST